MQQLLYVKQFQTKYFDLFSNYYCMFNITSWNETFCKNVTYSNVITVITYSNDYKITYSNVLLSFNRINDWVIYEWNPIK